MRAREKTQVRAWDRSGSQRRRHHLILARVRRVRMVEVASDEALDAMYLVFQGRWMLSRALSRLARRDPLDHPLEMMTRARRSTMMRGHDADAA